MQSAERRVQNEYLIGYIVGDDAHIVPFRFIGNLLRADVGIRPYIYDHIG